MASHSPSQPHSIHTIPSLIVALISTYGTAAIGAWLTSASVKSWYLTIEKPVWNPPNITFPIVWNILYLLMALAVWRLWTTNAKANNPWHTIRMPLTLFALQLLLNIAWSWSFFYSQDIALGFGVIILTWLTLLPTLQQFFHHDKIAGWLLVPYTLWLSFAAVLNGTILLLN